MSEEQQEGATPAAVVEDAVEPAPPAPAPTDHPQDHPHGACANCGTPLAGPYCHACGQRGHLHRSLLHLAEEVLHGVLHFDTKAWRTLPLLVARPGLLTRRYIDGQRARHVPPLALFLFTMFLMFFVVSLTASAVVPTWMIELNDAAGGKRADLLEVVKEARQEVGDQERELEATRRDKDPVDKAERNLARANQALQEAEAALKAFDAAAPQRAALAAMAPASAQKAGNAASAPAMSASNAHVETGITTLNAAIERVIKNPELAIYKLKNTAYKFSFLLVPLLLPFMWLMFFWRRDIAVYDHAVFSLYSLSFMALLTVTAALLSMTRLDGHLGWLLWLVPVHVFLQFARHVWPHRLGRLMADHHLAERGRRRDCHVPAVHHVGRLALTVRRRTVPTLRPACCRRRPSRRPARPARCGGRGDHAWPGWCRPRA